VSSLLAGVLFVGVVLAAATAPSATLAAVAALAPLSALIVGVRSPGA
jgi:hypothetical protein